MLTKIAIVGRPNVGKSSLFNRITRSKRSIIENTPGVTRDRLYEKVIYKDKEFILIDTGGITLGVGEFNEEIKIQAEIAIDESDIILHIVDAQTGITQDDDIVAKILRGSSKKIIVVVNKVDNQELKDNLYEFYSLGFENVIPVSALHGGGIYDVLDLIENDLIIDTEVLDDGIINFSLIGKPNVGKSSLFNALVLEEKSIVSPIEGTTRDSVDTIIEKDSKEYRVIDTAGIRRRGKVYEKIEKYSVLRALDSIEKSDIVLWMFDAFVGVKEQDKRVLGYAYEQNKPIIVVVNKWDLIDKETNTQIKYEKNLREKMPFLKESLVIFLSALTKKGVNKILPAIDHVYLQYTYETTTAKVNNVLNEAVLRKMHPTHKGQTIKFYYATQVSTKPPKFLIFVNNKNLVHFSYERYLKNYFKKSFSINQVNIELVFKNRKDENDV